jgi:hypothetical protein
MGVAGQRLNNLRISMPLLTELVAYNLPCSYKYWVPPEPATPYLEEQDLAAYAFSAPE